MPKDRYWAAVFVRFTGDFRRHCTGIIFALHIWARSYIKMSKRAVNRHTYTHLDKDMDPVRGRKSYYEARRRNSLFEIQYK